MAPPLFSTFSAITELFVTVAVGWFFWRAFAAKDYRWGVITVAIVYETLFNITYMVRRTFEHEEGVTHTHDAWVTWFVGIHGALSLLMFLGLIGFVVWLYRQTRAGNPDPVSRVRGLSYAFLALWSISVLTGEAIYLFYWTGVVQ